MKKKREVSFNLSDLKEGELKFVGKGIYAMKLGTFVDIYRRHWNVNPKQTLAMIVSISILLGIVIGAILWY